MPPPDPLPPKAPSSPWPAKTRALDNAVVALIAVGGVAMLMGNIVILWNRSYRPIKTKSVLLTLLSSLGGLIWIIAAIVVNDHFPRRRHSGLDFCVLWTYWLQACFGFSLWLNCLTLRLIVLYRIFIYKSDNRTYCRFLIILLAPAVVFCIVASVTDQIRYKHRPVHDKGAVADCEFKDYAFSAYVLLALLVIYFLIFLGFAFALRNAMAQFNEFRLIRRGGILSLFLFLLSLVTLNTHAYYKPVGRSLLSAAVASTIFYYFWARNGVVIYNVLFHRSEYLEQFHKELKNLPSQHEREKSSAGFLKMEAQFREVRAEAEKLQEKIQELEAEVLALEMEYTAKQQMTSPHSPINASEIMIVMDYH